MAYFAKLDDNNIVLGVDAVDDSNCGDLSFPESEPIGIAFLTQWSGGYANWKQTSIDNSFRKNYAGINYAYDATLDAFIPPKPYPSWLLNTSICQWEPPIPYPDDGKKYYWDEQTQSWVPYEN